MVNTKLHKALSLHNHYRLLELSIFSSKVIVELLQHIPLANYPTVKLEGCLRVLDAQLDEAIQCARECKETFRKYSQSLNQDARQA